MPPATPGRADKALALLEVPRPQGTVEDPEDMRVLVKVLLALGDTGRRKQAIEVLESMVTQSLASIDDRHLLAQLEEAFGDWSKARDHYRDLIMRTNKHREPRGAGHLPHRVCG